MSIGWNLGHEFTKFLCVQKLFSEYDSILLNLRHDTNMVCITLDCSSFVLYGVVDFLWCEELMLFEGLNFNLRIA